jgi:hypothetical protein
MLLIRNQYSRENLMRRALEQLLGKPFLKARPAFLRNPATGRPLEFDAYNEELRIAAEFNGVQHERYPNPFHSTRKQFEAQQARDRLKAVLCQEQGIKLIVVPSGVQQGDLNAYLQQQLGGIDTHPGGGIAVGGVAVVAPLPPRLPLKPTPSSSSTTEDSVSPEDELTRAMGQLTVGETAVNPAS